VSERERAEVAVKSSFDEAIEQVKASGAPNAELEALRRERDAVIGDQQIWAGLARSIAIFVAPGFSEVFVLPNRLDDAINRDPENDDKPRGGKHGDRGVSGDERRKAFSELYAKRVADATRHELMQRDPDGHVPLFVFAAEPMLSLFIDRIRNGRRIVGVPGAPDRLGAAEIDVALREQLGSLNVAEADGALRELTEGTAGRVERDLAAIAREAADGAVEVFWFDFTTSVNGTLDRESGAIEFASGHGADERLSDGTHAGDLLPQLALLVMSKGGKVVTVRSDDLDGTVWSGPAMAELRFALA